MVLIDDNSTSLILFDHSLENPLLENNNNDSPLYNETSAADHNKTGWRCGTSSLSSSNFTTYLFFIFPIIGFFVLVMGSCLLRKRQVQQDAEAIQRYHERISAADSERRFKEERRTKWVEEALITIKVTFCPKKKTMLSSPYGVRARSATMETDVTVESMSNSTDSDSTISSSCTSLGAVRRVSEVSSDCDGGDDDDDGKALSEAEQGQQFTTSNLSKGCSPSASQTLSEALLLENSTTPFDWQSETCAICLEPYKENDDVSYSKHQNCSHAFHTSCILSWLKDEFRNDCPCCRGPYLHLCVVEEDGDYLGGNNTNNLMTTVNIAEVMDPTRFSETTNTIAIATIEREDSNV